MVSVYLKYLGPNDKKSHLIIPIDDFDLNVKAVAEMAEQIRKYLMIPEVIIFMAANMEQLADAKEQNIIEHFKLLREVKGDVIDSKLLTMQYLLKLIPYERQLKMPTASNILDGISVEIRKERVIINSSDSVFEFIQAVFLEKIGLIITKDQLLRLPIIPKTLREYISFLSAINAIKEESSKPDEDFISFFTSLFIERNRNAKEILLRINQEPLDRRNWLVIKSFNEDLDLKLKLGLIREELGVESDKYIEFISICDNNNKPHNITLGDLLFYFKVINSISSEKWVGELIQIIKLLHSINLSWFIKQRKDKEIVRLTNGGIYNQAFRQLIRNKRSRFVIDNFRKLQIDNIAIESFLGEKNKALTGVKEIEWLSYFIEYPKVSNYKQDTTPFYLRRIDIGRGSIIYNPYFNILQFVIGLHMPKDIFRKTFANYYKQDSTDKAGYIKIARKSLLFDIQRWKKANVAVLPFYNLFLMEELFEMIDTDYKEKATGYSSYFSYFTLKIKEYFEKLEEVDGQFKKICFSRTFANCPIISPILEQSEQCISVLDSIKGINDEELGINEKLQKLSDEITKTRIADKSLLSFVNKKIEELIDDSSPKSVLLSQIKNYMDNENYKRDEFKDYVKGIIENLINKNE